MFVYDMGIIDFFAGMMPLSSYIKLCADNDRKEEEGEGWEAFLSIGYLKKFLFKSFMEVKINKMGWEGDIRQIAISAIPRQTGMAPYTMVAFKQSNNGSSFLASECKIYAFDDPEESDNTLCYPSKDLTVEELIEFYEESFDMVEKLFNNALLREKNE